LSFYESSSISVFFYWLAFSMLCTCLWNYKLQKTRMDCGDFFTILRRFLTSTTCFAAVFKTPFILIPQIICGSFGQPLVLLFLNFQTVVFWFSKILFWKRIFTEVVTRLSHDQVALFKTFRGTTQNCTRQTINHANKSSYNCVVNYCTVENRSRITP